MTVCVLPLDKHWLTLHSLPIGGRVMLQGANEPGARAVEAEASRIARRAAEALRQSRAAVQVLTLTTGVCCTKSSSPPANLDAKTGVQGLQIAPKSVVLPE